LSLLDGGSGKPGAILWAGEMAILSKLQQDKRSGKAKRVMQAMLQMDKFDIGRLLMNNRSWAQDIKICASFLTPRMLWRRSHAKNANQN
jgi:hypothetical protein